MPLELEKVKREMLQNKKKLGWNKTLFPSRCLSVKMSQRWGGGHPRTPPSCAPALIEGSKKSSIQCQINFIMFISEPNKLNLRSFRDTMIQKTDG